MSRLMAGAAVLGLGLYATSLGGEWTETELKEKKMASSTLLQSCHAIVDRDLCFVFCRR